MTGGRILACEDAEPPTAARELGDRARALIVRGHGLNVPATEPGGIAVNGGGRRGNRHDENGPLAR